MMDFWNCVIFTVEFTCRLTLIPSYWFFNYGMNNLSIYQEKKVIFYLQITLR
jgi:hypothetical protein